jgi:hypothetical protein
VLRLFGKLGGLNRLHLSHPPRLQYVGSAANGLVVRAAWASAGEPYMPPEEVGQHDQERLEAVFSGAAAAAALAALSISSP